MVSLFFVITLALAVLFCIKSSKDYKKDKRHDDHDPSCWEIAAMIFVSVSFVLFGWLSAIISNVRFGYIIDEKIAMYEEENASIEKSINDTVKSDMDFKLIVSNKLKGQDDIKLILFFPELESNILVQRQLEKYIASNDKIKELKEVKNQLPKLKWQLYFGS